jgi:frataxin
MFSRAPVSQALRTSLRRATIKPPARSTAPFTQTVILARSSQSTRPTIRFFSSSAATLTRVTPRPEGSSPDSSKKLHAGAEHVVEPASITDAQYHELADTYIDRLVEKLERIQEDREEVEVEYSVCVLRHLPAITMMRALRQGLTILYRPAFSH